MNDKVKDILSKLKKKNGQESVQLLGSNESVQGVKRISTGCYSLDQAIGGGIPLGRVVQIFGPESSGKSTICLQIVAQFQKQNKTVGYIDTQFSLDPVYAKALGVNISDILLCQPQSGQQAFNVALDMIENGVDLVVIDSVAALVPLAEQEGSMEDQQMGVQARLLSKGLRKITGPASKHQATVLFTNQLRSKIGVMYGNPQITAGGKALPYYSSVRISLNGGNLGDKNAAGQRINKIVKATIVKNKTFPPFKTAQFIIRFGEGIDKLDSLLTACFDANIFEKSGAWIKIDGESYCQGVDTLREKIQSTKSEGKLKEFVDSLKNGTKTLDNIKNEVLALMKVQKKVEKETIKPIKLKDKDKKEEKVSSQQV